MMNDPAITDHFAFLHSTCPGTAESSPPDSFQDENIASPRLLRGGDPHLLRRVELDAVVLGCSIGAASCCASRSTMPPNSAHRPGVSRRRRPGTIRLAAAPTCTAARSVPDWSPA
jgi:hypothetical protein